MTFRLRKKLSAFGRGEDGIASVEFALLFPVVFFMFIWAVELGILMTKSVMLEHGLDLTMRELRLGRLENPTSDSLKDDICSHLNLISDCRSTIMIELQPIRTDTWALPAQPVTCRDRDEEIVPVLSFSMGQSNEIMLVRACVIVQTLFPGTGIGAMLNKDASGGFGIAAMSAFVNEPA